MLRVSALGRIPKKRLIISLGLRKINLERKSIAFALPLTWSAKFILPLTWSAKFILRNDPFFWNAPSVLRLYPLNGKNAHINPNNSLISRDVMLRREASRLYEHHNLYVIIFNNE